MRVIAGVYKGRRLAAPTWPGLRPTSDKLRETLFNVLMPRIAGARVLDGCAGTGALGIEALSRGAAHVTFVDRDQRAIALIAENLERCGIEQGYAMMRGGIDRAAGARVAPGFGVILLDPPYDEPDVARMLERAGALLAPGGILVLEHARRRPAPAAPGGLVCARRILSGDSALAFYEPMPDVTADQPPTGPCPERVAVYPGSFDPMTNGHVDIILRGARIFDRIVVAVLVNSDKKPLFSIDERVETARAVFGDEPKVEVEAFEGLLIDFARQKKASVIVRGLRAVSDFEFEFQMALMNRRLAPDIEIVFMMPAEAYTYISSRLVREVYSLGGQVTGLVPEIVEARLRNKYARD